MRNKEGGRLGVAVGEEPADRLLYCPPGFVDDGLDSEAAHSRIAENLRECLNVSARCGELAEITIFVGGARNQESVAVFR